MVYKWPARMAVAIITFTFVLALVPAPTSTAGNLLGGDDGTGERPDWGMQTVTLENGRKYFALMPSCAGARCNVPRQLFIFTHGVNGAEDVLNAKLRLTNSHNADPDAIFAFSVSKNGTKRFDAGANYCCTFVETNEVDYLVDVAEDIAAKTPVDQSQVGLFGLSNGGMLSERAICLRPDVFVAAASWAGTWTTQYEGCQHGTVSIEQWHGTNDTVAPIEGGMVTVDGHQFYLPPATELGTKITPESHFALHVIPGEDHVAPGWVIDEMIAFLNQAGAN